MVDQGEIPHSRKLSLLLQYCKGEARSAFECCEVMTDAKEAYKEARSILKKRIGDEYTICQAFIKRVQNHPNVHESGFRKYADTLSGAMKTLQELNYLETQHNLCQII